MNKKLPLVCAVKHPETDKIVFVRRGESGYYEPDAVGVAPDTDPDVWNEANNITKAESAAMLAGSLFSWESPAANPKNYDEAGTLKEQPWRPGGAA